MTTTRLLDTDELLHLAIGASKENNHDAAITYLKRALSTDSRNAKALYLLAAEHAQIGLFDRALDELEEVVSIEPEMMTAHFQRGLLFATSGKMTEATEAWRPLDKLGKQDFLYLFKMGLIFLAQNQFEKCREYLEQGIALNQLNEALNEDMRSILEKIRDLKDTEVTQEEESEHLFLSAYKNDK